MAPINLAVHFLRGHMKNQQKDTRWLLFWIFFAPGRWRKIEADALNEGPLNTLTLFSLKQLKDRAWGGRLLRQNLLILPAIPAEHAGRCDRPLY